MARHCGGWLLLTLFGLPAEAAIVLDGRLDEPEWQQAQRLADFQTTVPYTLGAPELGTVVLLHADAEGLYVGFICDQPPTTERIRTRGQRDQFVAGDRVNLMVDFDGSGTTAYEFSAYLGGEKQDAIISRQVNYNYDWDGDWDYAAGESEGQWFIEYRIPWGVAPMAAPTAGQRTLGVFFSRVVEKTGRRYSLPGHAFTRATFVTDMRKVRLAAHEKARLDLFPYGSATHDVLAESNETRGGLDLFWKPSSQHQLTATVNPDFGHVEADQLVVNFGAIPTFFADKRPFFTENLDLFSTEFNVLYTRRVGARPDAGPEGHSHVLGALKYTGASGDLAYGLIGALEDDSSLAEGRDFYVGRLRYQLAAPLTVGWLGTHVERPTLARRADVNALDLNWTIAQGISVNLQGIQSEVDDAQPGFLDPSGTGRGGTLLFRYAPGGNVDHFTSLVSKDERFNINDAGFQSRPSEHLVETDTTLYWRDWPADSAIDEHRFRLYGFEHWNDSGERLQGYVQTRWTAVRRDTREYGALWTASGVGGTDDLIARGHGGAKLPIGHRFDVFYRTAKSGWFRAYTQLGIGQSNWVDEGFHLFYMEPGLYPTESFSITGTLEFYDFADDLQWQPGDPQGDLLGAFQYEQQYVALNLNWFPVERHEIRTKFQWIAASGEAVGAYRPDANQTLSLTGDPIADYSFVTTALQLRYRYEFAPLSEFFFVYSRGGFDSRVEAERNSGSSLRRGLAEETSSQFLVKLRYRFALL